MRFVWKHLPLAIHNDAPAAHLASVAAQKQGKFWEFHDKLFANQRQIKMDNLKQYAQELGLDMPRFEKDMLDLKNKTSIDADMAEASAMGGSRGRRASSSTAATSAGPSPSRTSPS